VRHYLGRTGNPSAGDASSRLHHGLSRIVRTGRLSRVRDPIETAQASDQCGRPFATARRTVSHRAVRRRCRRCRSPRLLLAVIASCRNAVTSRERPWYVATVVAAVRRRMDAGHAVAGVGTLIAAISSAPSKKTRRWRWSDGSALAMTIPGGWRAAAHRSACGATSGRWSTGLGDAAIS